MRRGHGTSQPASAQLQTKLPPERPIRHSPPHHTFGHPGPCCWVLVTTYATPTPRSRPAAHPPQGHRDRFNFQASRLDEPPHRHPGPATARPRRHPPNIPMHHDGARDPKRVPPIPADIRDIRCPQPPHAPAALSSRLQPLPAARPPPAPPGRYPSAALPAPSFPTIKFARARLPRPGTPPMRSIRTSGASVRINAPTNQVS